MKPTLLPGVTAAHTFLVSPANTVPHLAKHRSTFTPWFPGRRARGAAIRDLYPVRVGTSGEGRLALHQNSRSRRSANLATGKIPDIRHALRA